MTMHFKTLDRVINALSLPNPQLLVHSVVTQLLVTVVKDLLTLRRHPSGD